MNLKEEQDQYQIQQPIRNFWPKKLKDTLSKEDFKLFSQYIDLFQKRVDKDLEEKYIQGFKTGLQIGIESSKIKL